MAFSLEPEEWVGAHWHRWVSRHGSDRHYPQQAVALADIQGALGVFFRIGGGDRGLGIDAISERESGHRLSLRQRLGIAREQLARARLDDHALQLPATLDLLPSSTLNRDLYFWLAAYFAAARAVAPVADPLQADILALRHAQRASARALERFPGLGPRYARLCLAVLAERRPRPGLPAAEAALESAVRTLLERGAANAVIVPAAVSSGEDRTGILRAVFDHSAPVTAMHAASGYRPLLPVPLWGAVLTRELAARAAPDETPEPEDVLELEQPVTGGARKALRQRQEQCERDDPLVFNRFEKLLSIAEMVNLNRLVDDDPDERAAKSAEQFEELTLSPHARKSASRLQIELELSPEAAVGARLEGSFTYPEWDYRKRCYLPNQSRVLTSLHAESAEHWQPDAATRRRVRRVERQFEGLRPRRVVLRGQPDGNELDTDAVVRGHCDQLATGVPNERVYLDSRPQARDLAVSVLVDNSLSTDAWLEDRRVIDVSREALWVFANGLDRCGDDYAIATFTSRRRHNVQVNQIKRFDEAPGARVDKRIAALTPGAYTRMGPAIRHAAHELALRPNRHRLLLILSDGKPNDTDYYEGRYAIEDTRRAVLDVRRQDIRVFAVTIDHAAGQYIPRLFGRGGYALVNRPENLTAALPRIYRQITCS
ncbi:MAG: VWA domain-containing protein [Halioglobus sp.]|nr:VWA domain-containing protein [Halioglobus sp.]